MKNDCLYFFRLPLASFAFLPHRLQLGGFSSCSDGVVFEFFLHEFIQIDFHFAEDLLLVPILIGFLNHDDDLHSGIFYGVLSIGVVDFQADSDIQVIIQRDRFGGLLNDQ